MNDRILTLRITRRAIGAAALSAGELTLLDGRYLNPRPERIVPAALRYLTKLLDLTRPDRVVLDAPSADEMSTMTGRIVDASMSVIAERGIPVVAVSRLDILNAFGVTRITDRREARELARILWPDVQRVTGKVQPYVADAVAAAAYVECRLTIGPQMP